MSQVVTEENSTPPRKGTRIDYKGREVGTVDHIDGNLCWVKYDDGSCSSFIWRFRDGLNALHDWPGKTGKLAPCPGVHAVNGAQDMRRIK